MEGGLLVCQNVDTDDVKNALKPFVAICSTWGVFSLDYSAFTLVPILRITSVPILRTTLVPILRTTLVPILRTTLVPILRTTLVERCYQINLLIWVTVLAIPHSLL